MLRELCVYPTRVHPTPPFGQFNPKTLSLIYTEYVIVVFDPYYIISTLQKILSSKFTQNFSKEGSIFKVTSKNVYIQRNIWNTLPSALCWYLSMLEFLHVLWSIMNLFTIYEQSIPIEFFYILIRRAKNVGIPCISNRGMPLYRNMK